MSIWLTIGAVILLAVVLPVVASVVMAVFLEAANNDGIYDDDEN
jgi:hypothetical protein